MFVRTDRLMLRPGFMEDAEALCAAVRSDPAIARNTARIPWPYTLDDARGFIAHQQRQQVPLDTLVFARTSGAPRLVGAVGLIEDDGAHELGYWIARPYWGLGFATEAGAAMLRAGRGSLKLPCLRAGHFADNPASGRVLRKLGFRPTGRSERRHSLARGGDAECLLYAEGPVETPCGWPVLELAA